MYTKTINEIFRIKIHRHLNLFLILYLFYKFNSFLSKVSSQGVKLSSFLSMFLLLHNFLNQILKKIFLKFLPVSNTYIHVLPMGVRRVESFTISTINFGIHGSNQRFSNYLKALGLNQAY